MCCVRPRLGSIFADREFDQDLLKKKNFEVEMMYSIEIIAFIIYNFFQKNYIIFKMLYAYEKSS